MGCHNSKLIKLLATSSLKLIHMCSCNSKHSFQDSFIALCTFRRHEESVLHFPLNYLTFADQRFVFQSTIRGTGSNLLNYADSILTHTLHFGNSSFVKITNTQVLHAWIDIISFMKMFFRRIVFLKHMFHCVYS